MRRSRVRLNFLVMKNLWNRAPQQFARHLTATRTNDERRVTVFNSSVENRVEKAQSLIETARQQKTYTLCTHFGANETPRENFLL
jgi:DNA polymerase IIIc chi subunit